MNYKYGMAVAAIVGMFVLFISLNPFQSNENNTEIEDDDFHIEVNYAEEPTKPQESLVEIETEADKEEEKPPFAMNKSFLFGLDISNYTVHLDRIKRNQFLGDILGACNVEYSLVDKLVKEADDVFDVRHIQANRPYTIFCSTDSLEKAEIMVYEHEPTEYVVFDMRDSLDVRIVQKEITTRLNEASGVIYSSLSQSMQENGLPQLLVAKMSEVYAWTVDFFKIQKGDRFKVIYEEKYADGEFIGVGEIKAAYFKHYDDDFYAINYAHEDIPGGDDYYDENAESLRKVFLKAPLKYSRISSRYQKKRFHPVLRRNKPHLGTDYAAKTGTPIMATADGKIIAATYHRGNGNYVKIRHNGIYSTQYLHMSKFAKGIKKGVKVKQGDVIGYVGSTGLATGPHVCYRFWKHGKQLDPYKEKLPDADPLKKHLVPAYNIFKDSVKARLDHISFPITAKKNTNEI